MPAARQERLLGLVKGMAPAHPAEALRLLQLCAVARLSHFMRGLPPAAAAEFFRTQDTGILEAFRAISACPVDLGPFCTVRLPVSLGGAALPSLERHSTARHLGGFYDFAGPLTARLRAMPRVNWVLSDALAHYLSNPAGGVAASFPWARSLAASAEVARSLWHSFRPWEVAMATGILPSAPAFLRAGDPHSAPTAPSPPPASTFNRCRICGLRLSSPVACMAWPAVCLICWHGGTFSIYMLRPPFRIGSDYFRSLDPAASLSYPQTQAWPTLPILRCSALPSDVLSDCLPWGPSPVP